MDCESTGYGFCEVTDVNDIGDVARQHAVKRRRLPKQPVRRFQPMYNAAFGAKQ